MKSAEPSKQVAPVLIFTYGNPSRGDDGLGPAMFELLDKDRRDSMRPDKVELLTDYQLQIEHALDLEQRQCVLFVDAAVNCSAPFDFYPIKAQRDDSYTTHAMSPLAVLDVYQQINQRTPPPSYMLTIRGYEFGLGQAMSEQAETNLQQAYQYIRKLLAADYRQWQGM